ncbi:DNA methyltransferase [Actinokineospora cianjurensis]|uniref:DNA methylase n=1 Tax=Actinokineospora cianjurensis TaxID=585224 RepID=A0A421BC47_9PSEU|nr:DNA methyltransferase [Actinokineospora cianjurensis]RLK61944.1 DNA methylase [Actinokineospora cianjurensis]
MNTNTPDPSDHQAPGGGSVWLTGQTDLATQLADGGYHPRTATDPDLIPPAIAAEIISRYTWPGELVLDPDCGPGTTLVEALRHGRPALGLTTNPRWWRLARTNITAAKHAGAWSDGSVLDHPATALTHIRAAGTRGTATLAITALRNPTRPDAVTDLTTTLNHTRAVLHPDGHIAVVAAPTRDARGELLDLPTTIHTAARAAGLVPVHHAIAVTAALHHERVHTRASLTERRRVRRHPSGRPIALVAHRHVLVFRPAHVAVLASAARGVRDVDGSSVGVARYRRNELQSRRLTEPVMEGVAA